MNPTIFREYDIRGVADRDFDSDFDFTMGRAYGTLAVGRGKRRVYVGRDCRLTSEKYAAALRQGVGRTGYRRLPHTVDVLFPLSLRPARRYRGHGKSQFPGVQRLHDLPGQNHLHGEQIRELRNLVERSAFARGRGKEERAPIIEPYQEILMGDFGSLVRKIVLVVDAGNGTAGPVSPGVFLALGCQVNELFCELDGRFPNHLPYPTLPENMAHLIAKVQETGAELGIAYGGDADRLGLIDRTGRIILWVTRCWYCLGATSSNDTPAGFRPIRT